MSESMKDRSLDEIRAAYREYLTTQGLSLNTIMASSTDAFFIWRKRGLKAFWQIVLSDEFESLGKDVLLDLLQQQPDGNAKANMSRYMSHLRRFRRYVESSSNVDMPATVTDKPVPTAVKTTQLLLPPSVEQVEHYLGLWDSLEDYRLQEAALNRLFFSLCPENADISDILLKVSVLNDFYSTNIFKVYPVAKHILELHIDQRLRKGDVTLVDDMKSVTIRGKKLSFYSFATKYCSHHMPLDYPIYDSYVDEVLRYYRKTDRFAAFQNGDLKKYASFKAILEDFRSFYHLEKYNLKQLDKYLWQLGKEYFNKYE